MPQQIHYNPSAALEVLGKDALEALEAPLQAARDDVLADVELYNSGGSIPEEKQPLDAGFIELPTRLLLEEVQACGDANAGQLGRIDAVAESLSDEIDRLVVLGIGGSYMGMRALFEALCHPYHNELTRGERKGVPRLHFEGKNLDNDTASGLLDVLHRRCDDPDDVEQRWGIVVISKSGGTLETAVSFRIFRDALETYYGADSDYSRRLVVPITGESGKLRDFSDARGYPESFPIPDGVGGRFSVFTAVGLLPAAVLGIDIKELLRGAEAMTERFRNEPIGSNPVLDYVGVCHHAEQSHDMTIRVLSTWGDRLEALGLWYDQLLSESLGKEERGATPLTAVNTRDLHSRGQQHQEGRRDKLITNVMVKQPSEEPLRVPEVPGDRNQDQLNALAGKPMSELLSAAIAGTNQAYADVGRPTADIVLPELNAFAVGELLQMLMLATVTEGRLIGINPYGQPGVEAYKQNMGKILYG